MLLLRMLLNKIVVILVGILMSICARLGFLGENIITAFQCGLVSAFHHQPHTSFLVLISNRLRHYHRVIRLLTEQLLSVHVLLVYLSIFSNHGFKLIWLILFYRRTFT